MIKPFFTSALIAAFFAAAPAGAEVASPFGYPSTTLDAPATLTEPVGEFVQFGREPFFLGSTGLREVAERFRAARLREGAGYFERDFACFTGTEGGRPMIVWLIATASSEITEAQIEWVKDEREVPRTCGRLEARNLPVRLGLTGLGMTEKKLPNISESLPMKTASDGNSGSASASSRMPGASRSSNSTGSDSSSRTAALIAVLPRSRATLKGALDCDTPRNRTSRRHFRPRT